MAVSPEPDLPWVDQRPFLGEILRAAFEARGVRITEGLLQDIAETAATAPVHRDREFPYQSEHAQRALLRAWADGFVNGRLRAGT